jgi:hypothetical protein
MLVAIRGPPFVADGPFDVEILVALPDGEGSGPGEEFMAEDFCDEDVLGGVPIADGPKTTLSPFSYRILKF